MGSQSKYERFHESGDEANVNNVDKFGTPAKSLFTSTKVFSMKHHIDITDEKDNVVYISESKVFSLRDKTDIKDASGEQVAHIESKLISLHERHYVTMADGTKFELANEFMHLVKDVTNIEGLGWKLQGNIIGLNYELFDESGDIVAVVGQKMMSVHDKFSIDIYKPEYEKMIVAIIITLQHMLKDRQEAAAAAGGAAGAASYSSSN